jgi:hypothetical protein
MTRAGALGVTAVAIALLAPAVAWAQAPDDVARAEALFNAGKQLRDAGQYADAIPQFAQSSHLAPGVGVSLYLADCYERTGRTASAWTEFRKAEKLARDRNDKRADLARAREEALESKLSGLTIAVPPAVARAAPEVLLDGARIPPDEWNAGMAVDPGDHVITVSVAGHEPRMLAAHVEAGSRSAVVHLDDIVAAAVAPAPTATPVAPPAPPPSEPATPPDSGAARRWLGIGFLGLGATGIGVGTAIVLNKNQTNSNLSSCAPAPPDNGATLGSTIAFAAGGIALATGLILTVSASHPKGMGMVVAPLMTAGGGGALVQATF